MGSLLALILHGVLTSERIEVPGVTSIRRSQRSQVVVVERRPRRKPDWRRCEGEGERFGTRSCAPSNK